MKNVILHSHLTQDVILNVTKWSEESDDRAKKKFLDSSPDESGSE